MHHSHKQSHPHPNEAETGRATPAPSVTNRTDSAELVTLGGARSPELPSLHQNVSWSVFGLGLAGGGGEGGDSSREPESQSCDSADYETLFFGAF